MEKKKKVRTWNWTERRRELYRPWLEEWFPKMMKSDPEKIFELILEYLGGVESINGIHNRGRWDGNGNTSPDGNIKWYLKDRLVNEKWEEDSPFEVSHGRFDHRVVKTEINQMWSEVV